MRRLNAGFTLLEVLIAITILAGGIILVSTSWSGNFLRLRKANLYNNVALLLERKTVEIESQYAGKALEEITDLEGDFGSDLPQYRWTFTTHDFAMPDMSAAIIGQDNPGDKEMLVTMVKQTGEYFSKAIKEGTVTIFVKAGEKESTFSITTYFVDYDKPFSLPGGIK